MVSQDAKRTPTPSPAIVAPASVGGAADSAAKLAVAGGPKRCPACGTHYPADFLVCPRDATPLVLDENAAKDPLIGAILGETYQVRGVIGEGGMGRVYEARHVRLADRRLAIKVLHQEYARDADVVQRFQREAESASAIQHPNVVEVYDVHKTADGRPYLVGEFLEGEELGEYLKRVGKLDVPTAVAITRQVANALSAAHARGIVHRDMKPENVFIVARPGIAPHVKVLDFGISKARQDNKANLTRTGMIMGTPSYMAPEQARGEKVDHRADVYATGGVLYSLLTGKRPFDDDDPAKTLTQVLTVDPPRPRSLEPSIPEALELVIQRAMAKDPRDRYQSMEELDVALFPFDTGGAVPLAGAASIAAASRASSGAMPAASMAGALSPGGAGAGAGAGVVGNDRDASTLLAAGGGATRAGTLAGGGTTALGSAAAAAVAASAAAGARAAKLARPTIVLSGAAVLVWFLAGFVDAMAGTIRWFRPGEITFTEAVLLAAGSVALAVAPAVLFVMRVRRTVWPNSVKSVELAGDVRRTAAVALLTYGVGSLVVRVLDTVILRSAADISSGLWDAALFVASFVAALIAGGAGPLSRSLKRKSQT